MNRRAFLTALSAIPAVALFPGLLRAEPDDAVRYQAQLHQFVGRMLMMGDKPDAFFVTRDVMLKLAEAISRTYPVNIQHDEFESPWGYDIVGTRHVRDGHIDVACKNSGALYFFEWGSQAHVRKSPKEMAVEWNRSFVGTSLELPQR